MGDCYGRATCTIAAMATADSSEGIFTERLGQRYLVHSCSLGPDCDSSNPSSSSEVALRAAGPHTGRNIQDSPLFRRGWALQERVLSRRILYWAKDALFWECTALNASKAHPHGLPSSTGLHPYDRFPNTNFAKIFSLSKQDSLSVYWLGLVHHYSTLKFTYDSDRPVALQRLINLLENRFSDNYIHGLWRSQLLRGLRWRPLSAGRKVLSPCYPSWSWMSTTAKIQFPLEPGHVRVLRIVDDKEFAQILRVDTGSDLEENGSKVQVGQKTRLHIKAQFDQVVTNTESSISFYDSPTMWGIIDIRGVSIEFDFDTDQYISASLATEVAEMSKRSFETGQRSQYWQLQDEVFEIMVVGRAADDEGSNRIYGLIVQQTEQESKFIRIGMVILTIKSEALCNEMISSFPERMIALVWPTLEYINSMRVSILLWI